jgi:RNA recognition motif-containing protein
MNIYCANLSYKNRDEELASIFSEYGEVVSAKVVLDRESNRSRGFGFVEMSSDEDAKKAIAELNGKEIDGRALVVNEARQRNS